MPTFRTAPSTNLTASIKRLLATGGGQISPLQEIQVDQAAADTAHKMSLAEKVRQEVEAEQQATTARADPARHTEFASHSASINLDDGNRLMAHIRGALEQPSTADEMDANIVGRSATPFRTVAPVIEPGQDRRFRSALAAATANLIGTGKTNADQLTQATGNVQTQGITEAVQAAIARGDYHGASAMSQGAKPGTAIKLHENIGNTGATFAPATGNVRADPAADPTNKLLPATIASEAAQAEQRRAAAEASRAAAAKNNREKGEGAKPPTGFRWGPPDAEGNPTLVKIPGGPAEDKATSSDAERIAAGYFSRMDSAAKLLASLEEKGIGKPGLAEAAARGAGAETTANVISTADRQKYRQAQEDWVRAKLRKESGAVIANDEMEREIRVYFPMIGDSKAVLQQKADARRTAEAAMKTAAGRAAPKGDAAPTVPAGEVQARKMIGNVEFVKINGTWYEP